MVGEWNNRTLARARFGLESSLVTNSKESARGKISAYLWPARVIVNLSTSLSVTNGGNLRLGPMPAARRLRLLLDLPPKVSTPIRGRQDYDQDQQRMTPSLLQQDCLRLRTPAYRLDAGGAGSWIPRLSVSFHAGCSCVEVGVKITPIESGRETETETDAQQGKTR